MRVNRKVKIDGRWVLAPVPLDKGGRPDAKHVMWKGELVPVDHGTFYLAAGHGSGRKQFACGTDADSVKRAMKTQSHVLELRRRGMEVSDAPEILESQRAAGDSLRAIADAFEDEPPTGFTKKTIQKYINALDTFATWAAAAGIYGVSDVTKQTIGRWIAHLQKSGLDGSTIVPKVRIVLAELKTAGNEVKLDERSMPAIVERERDIYSAEDLSNLFRACTLEEYELFQTFLLTGMRYREVAFLAWSDVDSVRFTIRVSRKRDLDFTPKAYHERTIPIPKSLVDLLQARGERLASDGAGLIFATSRSWAKRGSKGGKADKKMLDKLKQIARRSGLNCGHCIGSHKGEPVTCKTHPVCRRWGLHKFRHTYATNMLRDKTFDIRTIKEILGHQDIETTMIYLRALDAEMAQPHVEQSTLATRFAGNPPEQGKAQRASRRRA